MRTYVRDLAGTAHGRFERAIERQNVLQAEMAARELRELSLMEALSLVVCCARLGSPCGLALAVDEVAVRVLIEPIEVAGVVVGEDVTL